MASNRGETSQRDQTAKINSPEVRTVKEVIEAVKEAEKRGWEIRSSSQLGNAIRQIYWAVGAGEDLDWDKTDEILKTLERLPESEKNKEVRALVEESEEKIEQALAGESQGKVEAGVMPAEIKGLVEEYERYLSMGIKEREAREKVLGRVKGAEAKAAVRMAIEKSSEAFRLEEKRMASLEKTDEARTSKPGKEERGEEIRPWEIRRIANEYLEQTRRGVERNEATARVVQTSGREVAEERIAETIEKINQTAERVEGRIRDKGGRAGVAGVKTAAWEIAVEKVKAEAEIKAITGEEIRTVTGGAERATEIVEDLAVARYCDDGLAEKSARKEAERMTDEIKNEGTKTETREVMLRAGRRAAVEARVSTEAEVITEQLIGWLDKEEGVKTVRQKGGQEVREEIREGIREMIVEGNTGRGAKEILITGLNIKEQPKETGQEAEREENRVMREAVKEQGVKTEVRELAMEEETVQVLRKNATRAHGTEETIAELKTRGKLEGWSRRDIQDLRETFGKQIEAREQYREERQEKEGGLVIHLGREEERAVEIAGRNTDRAVDEFVGQKRAEVRWLRSEIFKERLVEGFYEKNKTADSGQIKRIERYAEAVTKLYFHERAPMWGRAAETTINQVVEITGKPEGEIRRQAMELRAIMAMAKMDREEYVVWREEYIGARRDLGDINWQWTEELGGLEDAWQRLETAPELNNLLAENQNFLEGWDRGRDAIGLIQRIDGWTGGFLSRNILGERLAGFSLEGRIFEFLGKQTTNEFLHNSLMTMAQQGTEQGLWTVLKGVVSGGVPATGAVGSGAATAGGAAAAGAAGTAGGVAAGGAGGAAAGVAGGVAAGGAAAAGGVAAGTAGGAAAGAAAGTAVAPVVGTIIGAVVGFLGGIVGGATIGKLKDKLKDFPGGILGAGVALTTLGLALPMALIRMMAFPVQIFPIVMGGMFAKQAKTATDISFLVSPKGVGGGDAGELPTWDPTIPIPEGCPNGMPVQGGTITQGPFAVGCSHEKYEAMDFGVAMMTPITATHDGAAITGEGPGAGKYVAIKSMCEGKEVISFYYHLWDWAFSGEKQVKRGEVIGRADDTGRSEGSHLHYQLRGTTKPIEYYLGLTKSYKGCCIDNGIPCQ